MELTYPVRPAPGGTRLPGYPATLEGRLGRALLPRGERVTVGHRLAVLGALAETW